MADSNLTERRKRTFELLVAQGLPTGEVVEQIAEEFETTETAIEVDIRRLEDWVDDLPPRTHPSGKFRVQELRSQRLRQYELAKQAREAGEADHEREVVRDIIKGIIADVQLCQSLGLTVEAGGLIELPEEIDEDDPLTGLAERDHAVAPGAR